MALFCRSPNALQFLGGWASWFYGRRPGNHNCLSTKTNRNTEAQYSRSHFPHRAKTMKPSHEKTSKRHLSHKSTEKLKVQVVFIGFQMTSWRPPSSDFQGPCESEAQPHTPPSQNYEARPRENCEKAFEPQKHWKAENSICFNRFSKDSLKASKFGFSGALRERNPAPPPPSKNYEAQQRENFEKASGPHEHRKVKSSSCFVRFSTWLLEGLQIW